MLGALGGKKVQSRYASLSGEQLGRAMVALAIDDEWVGRDVEPDVMRELG